MRICRVCGIEETGDNMLSGTNDTICKPCRAEERSKRRLKKQWIIIQEAGEECVGCGVKATQSNMCIFDFHHVDKTTKKEKISKLLVDGKPLNVVREEAEKCVLFCACCHRLHHQKYGY